MLRAECECRQGQGWVAGAEAVIPSGKRTGDQEFSAETQEEDVACPPMPTPPRIIEGTILDLEVEKNQSHMCFPLKYHFGSNLPGGVTRGTLDPSSRDLEFTLNQSKV